MLRWFKPYLAIAASLILAAAVFYIWRSRPSQSNFNEGLAALHSAFREERSVEARLSDFPYAQLANQRGGPPKIDYVLRDRAGRLLFDAVSKNGNAETHHALGQYYLAERQFDKSIEQLQAALKLDPNNAKICSDLGAAWLEQGKMDLVNPDSSKALDEFGRSLEYLNKSLALNPTFESAIFNRALCHEYLMHHKEAMDDWRTYLLLDKDSPWAIEAHRHLNELQQKSLSPPN